MMFAVQQVTLSFTSPFQAAGGVYSALWSAVSPVFSLVLPLLAVAVVLALLAAFIPSGSRRRRGRRSAPPIGAFMLLAGVGLYFLWTETASGNYLPLAILAAVIAAAVLFLRNISAPAALSRRPHENDAEYKGRIGETIVQTALRGLDSKMYVARHNLIIPHPHGRGTTEIDSAVFSYFGIFVIETKNWNCKIYGREGDKKWTLCYKPKEYPINPLLQNKMHEEAVRKIVGGPPESFHSVVVVLDNGKFPKGMPRNVIRPAQLGGWMRSKREAHFNGGELDEIMARVDAASDKSPDARQRHAESVQARRE